jgi:acyl-CoA synthetase (AMP-forming)/AMP-acid ligase II
MTGSSSPATLVDVLNAAPASRPALLIPETGARVSYESLRRQVAEAADLFTGVGIQRGDRVAMALPNGPAVIVSFLAASVAGTAAPLNPAYRYEEFCFYLEDTNARLLILPAEAPADDAARRAAAERNIPILTAETDASGEVHISGAAANRAASAPASDDVALMPVKLGWVTSTIDPLVIAAMRAISLANCCTSVRTFSLPANTLAAEAMPICTGLMSPASSRSPR